MNHLPAKLRAVLALSSLWLTASCDNVPPRAAPNPHQHDVSASSVLQIPNQQHVAPTPSVKQTVPLKEASPTRAASDSVKPVASGTAPQVSDDFLKLVIHRMLSPKLFKLSPTTTQAYFANIATLQPQKVDESWLRQFAGSSGSKHPWMAGVTVELQNDSGHWRLGQASVAWTPPKEHVRALYDRLVAEVRSTRGRKPSFGRNESDETRERLVVGWTWCKDECEADIELDTSGQAGDDRSPRVAAGTPVVLLTVYTPEGP